MADVATYKGFSDAQLAAEIVRLNTLRTRIYEQASMGDRSFSMNLDRIDRDFSQAMKAWRERGGTSMPTSESDSPGGNNVVYDGTTDFSGVEF